jgi:fucose permease
MFLALGAVVASVGPALGELASRSGTDLGTIGSVFSALFLGGLLGELAAGPLGDRTGERVVLFIGALLMAAGTLGLAASRSLWATLGLMFVAGLGEGTLVLGGNVWAGKAFDTHAVAALNLVNVFYGVGAFLGPLAASQFLRLGRTALLALWAPAAGFLLLAPFFLTVLPRITARQGQERAGGDASAAPAGWLASPALWVPALLLLVYVGAENGMGGWTTTYVAGSAGVSAETGAMVTSGFWLALTLGRILGVPLGLRLSSWRLLGLSVLTAVIGSAVLVLGQGNLTGTTAGTVLLGLGFGPIYPVGMAVVLDVFHGSGKVASVAGAMGSVGGALLPWLQGLLLSRRGIESGVWFVVAVCVTMLILAFVSRSVVLRNHQGENERAGVQQGLPAGREP